MNLGPLAAISNYLAVIGLEPRFRLSPDCWFPSGVAVGNPRPRANQTTPKHPHKKNAANTPESRVLVRVLPLAGTNSKLVLIKKH